jgi:hypothetical protein
MASKECYLGSFDSEAEAGDIYDKAALQLGRCAARAGGGAPVAGKRWSKYRGVTDLPGKGRWQVYIEGKYVGIYECEEEAGKAAGGRLKGVTELKKGKKPYKAVWKGKRLGVFSSAEEASLAVVQKRAAEIGEAAGSSTTGELELSGAEEAAALATF